MLRPAVIRCRLHTGGKSIADLKEQYKGQGLTYREFESLQRALDLFDGQELEMFHVVREREERYYVARWPKENMKIMDAVFEAEQTNPDKRYKGDKQKFMLEWLQGRYSAGAAFMFHPEDVEELETICEAANVPDQPPKMEDALPRWRQIKDKRRRRKKGAGKR